MSKKLDPNTPTKYDNSLPPYLQDFFSHHDRYLEIKTKLDSGEEVPQEWWLPLIEELRSGIISRFQTHWKQSSKTRNAFVAMNKEIVWENEDQRIINLTRRNIATIDRAFVENDLTDYIKNTIKGLIDPIRAELVDFTKTILASDEELEAVRIFVSGQTFFIDDLGQHLAEQEAWRKELINRVALVKYVHDWETFLLQVVKFEEKNHNSSAKKVPISITNVGARYRSAASDTMEEGFNMMKQLLALYVEAHQKPFEIKGVAYQSVVDRQLKCVAKVRTNFSGFNRDVLVLLEKTSDEIREFDMPEVVTNFIEAVASGEVVVATTQAVGFYQFTDLTAGILG